MTIDPWIWFSCAAWLFGCGFVAGYSARFIRDFDSGRMKRAAREVARQIDGGQRDT